MGGCMGQKVGSGQMTNLIKLELINIIWFSLKIYNLLRHPHLWVDGWVNGWAHVKPLKSNKSWPNWDNSIMDILDILLDILLKPPQPLMGLFFNYTFIFSFFSEHEGIFGVQDYLEQLPIHWFTCILKIIEIKLHLVSYFHVYFMRDVHGESSVPKCTSLPHHTNP